MDVTLANEAERLLWVPPSIPYYKPGGVFKGKDGFSKVLVFSAWEMVPRMIACTLSYECERRTIGKLYLNEPDKRNKGYLIEDDVSSGSSKRKATARFPYRKLTENRIKPLTAASTTLAELYNPVEHMGESLNDIRKGIKKQIQPLLDGMKREYGVTERGAPDADWYWVAPLLFDEFMRFNIWPVNKKIAIPQRKMPSDLADVLTSMAIAFPLISSGIYGYPKDEALKVATSAIQDFLKDYDLDVTLVVFDKSAFTISRELLGAVESYIDEHYIETHQIKRRQLLDVEREAIYEADEDVSKYNEPLFEDMRAPSVGAPAPLDDLVGNLDEPFSATLLRLIDAKEKTDVEVYKRANLDRKLFSKIRTGKGYMPSKRTAVALAVALELSLDETDDLLERAGYALSHSQKFDVIVEYFIVSGNYDIFEINEVLFKYDQPLLGG